MRYQVTHSTEYLYQEPVTFCRNEACLLPRHSATQNCIASALQIEPTPADVRERSDFFGNRISHFAIQYPHDTLRVTARSEVVTQPLPPLPAAATALDWSLAVDLLKRDRRAATLAALPCLYDSPLVKSAALLADYVRPSFAPGQKLVAAVTDLMARIYRDFSYDPGFTTIATPLAEVLKNRRGVCQDFAHLAIGGLRSIGLAARYVSGYLETLPPPGQPRLVGADASHAWFAVYVPGYGWLDFDPTNNQLPAEQHITVAWGRDFSDVSPLRGVALGGGEHKVLVSVDVARKSE